MHHIANERARETVMRFLAHEGGRQMVSATDAIRAVRREHPVLGASDPHLTDMIAGTAIMLDLDMELGSGMAQTALFDRWSADGVA